MVLTVGQNSYVSLDEANLYIEAQYANSPALDAWQNLTENQRILCLVNACMDMESLPFVGTSPKGQTLLFPRRPLDYVPESIKTVQIEIAVFSCSLDGKEAAAGAMRRASLQKQGVTSFSVDDLSEAYGDKGASLILDYPFLLSTRINHLLSRYLYGGYSLC